MKKKLCVAVLAMMMVFTLSGCGSWVYGPARILARALVSISPITDFTCDVAGVQVVANSVAMRLITLVNLNVNNFFVLLKIFYPREICGYVAPCASLSERLQLGR